MLVLACGNVFDGLSDVLSGPAEIRVEGARIARTERSMERPPGARVLDLSERTMSTGFIDTHIHRTMDAAGDPIADIGANHMSEFATFVARVLQVLPRGARS
jgi:imidazolonepropionase-like amidohydrolase